MREGKRRQRPRRKGEEEALGFLCESWHEPGLSLASAPLIFSIQTNQQHKIQLHDDDILYHPLDQKIVSNIRRLIFLPCLFYAA